MGSSLPRWCGPCALVLVAVSAHAAESSTHGLDYRVAPDVQRCPTQAEFEALLVREVGEDPLASNPDLGLKVELTPRTNGVAGVVEITQNGQVRGRRELASGDCAALAAALALVVGVELDPLALAQHKQAAAATAAATISTPQIQSTLPVEQPRHRTQALMGVGALVAGGLAPTVVPAVTFGASVRKPDWVGRWELGLEFQGQPPVTAPLGATGSGSVSHLLFTLLPCAHPWWIIGVCGLITGGVAIATGEGFGAQGSGTQTEGYAAAGLRVSAEVPLDSELLLALHVDAAYQITREPLQYCIAGSSSSSESGCNPPVTALPCSDGLPPNPGGVCLLWSPTPFTWNIGFALQGRIL